ncbi:MAG TPA: BamA/TamA family outer membrane protein [Candidatus Acidoferrales bacterium]|nr:BamA/TamA family outer membrane protein [Candidatus Acidoferrales bacterium]
MVPAFAAGLAPGITVADAQETIRQSVAAQMAALPKIYLSGLAGEDDASLADGAAATLGTFTGTWIDYQTPYSAWQALASGRQEPGSVFGLALNGLMQPQDGSILNDQTDPSTAYISFSILNPFASQRVTIDLPGMADARKKKKVAEIQEHLRGLDGKPWSVPAIRQALAPVYGNLGLTPEIQVFVRSETISIAPGPRFSSIVLTPEVPDGDIDSILWNLLTTAEFRQAIGGRARWIGGKWIGGRWIGGRELLYSSLGHAQGDEPYIVQNDVQIKQLLLSQQGYAMTLQPSQEQGANQYFDVRIQKAGAPTGATKKPPADAEGVDSQGLAQKDRETPGPETIGQGVTDSDKSSGKDQPRRIGVQVTYKPGQGIGTGGLFQISRIPWPFPNGTASLNGGGPSGNLFSGSYFADFLGFSKIHRRIAVRLNGSQTVTQHRFLAGRKVDETDTAGLGHVEWEPFRDWNGGDLRFSMDGSRATVNLASNTRSISTQNLTAAEFGAAYYLHSVEGGYPEQTAILPKVKIGLGASATERPFAHTTVVVTHHRSFDFWECNFAGRLESATRSTPLFEQPSFGGADVVRGFRADDGIGLRLWSLQSELLHPVPGLNAGKLKNAQIQQLVSGLRLAWFYDAGGVYQTTASAAGERSGLGMGLHIDMKLAVLKFDWAYGFGQAATGGARGKFYLGIQLSIPQ